MSARGASVLVVGETLVDIVHTPDGAVSEHVGGSPANVAMGIARLGHPTTLATTLGDDDHGTRCREQIEDHGVRIDNLDAGNHATSTAVATLDESGAATYDFDLHWDLRPVTGLERIGHVHTGSIAATLTPGESVVTETLVAARPHGTVSYDPNVRPTIMGSADEIRGRIEEIVALSDVVKASEDDIDFLYAGESLPEVMSRWASRGPSLVVVTRGGDGVTWLTRSGPDGASTTGEAPARVDTVADTVGAGDSFMAGLVSGLLDAGLLGDASARERLATAGTDEVWPAIDRALATSAVTVTRDGAYAPTREEL